MSSMILSEDSSMRAERTSRRTALLLLLLAQTAFFCFFLLRSAPGVALPLEGPWGRPLYVLTPDTFRYETPAINLARGGTLSLPLSDTKDRVVYDWVCNRRPEACLPDGTHPTTLNPPGFSIFVAVIYWIVGPQPLVVVGLQYLMLLGLFVVLEVLAARLLPKPGYWFVVVVACSYPFLAMYAVQLSSDFLHVIAFVGALAVLMLSKPGIARGLLWGGLLGVATLVRPYSLFVFPVLWLWPSIRRVATGRERVVSAAAFAVPLLLWALRNAYWFGRFLPMTTLGPGLVLMHSTLGWERSPYEQGAGSAYYSELAALAGTEDVSTVEASERLKVLAIERIKQHPERFVGSLIRNVPKLWVSVGSTNQGVSKLLPLLVLYMGGLLVLGVVGIWLTRRDSRWHPLIVAILVYWGFLLYSTGEARRTLPLRLPMLLAAGAAASMLIQRRSPLIPAEAGPKRTDAS